jgi:hypothetical protein
MTTSPWNIISSSICGGKLSWEGAFKNKEIFNLTEIKPTVIPVDTDV